jgi:cyclo(L-tyrosyl-L-tyrosyl) synthase
MTPTVESLTIQSIMYNPFIDGNDHAVIGISPFNGYYGSQNIEALVAWAVDNFKDFHLFTMNESSKYNLIAQGYSEEEAIKKTRKQDKHLYNKMVRALEKMGYSPIEATSKILLISHIKKNKRYQELYSYYYDFYLNNLIFKTDCLNATKTFLQEKSITVTDHAIEIAVQYLLEEIPVWFATPAIMNIDLSVFVYKDFPKYWKRICCDYNLVAPNQRIYIKEDIF